MTISGETSNGVIQGVQNDFACITFSMTADPDVTIHEMKLVFQLPEGFGASGLTLSVDLPGEGNIDETNNTFTWSSENGTALPAIQGFLLELSMSSPTRVKDGTYFISIDPEASIMSGSFGDDVPLAQIAALNPGTLIVKNNKGDINNDTHVDADDAVLALREYAKSMIGDSILTNDQLMAADVNSDSTVDADDAVLILKFYAAYMTNPSVTWEDLLN